MAKQESLKDQLKRAAKKRLARRASLAPPALDGPELDGSHAAIDSRTNGTQPQMLGANPASPVPPKSATTKSLDIIITALLTLDRHRSDLNDRAILVGLKSVLRGYAGAEPGAAAVYQAVVDAKTKAEIQPRPLRAAIDQLLQIVTAYGSNRETPRAALTYLHSVAS